MRSAPVRFFKSLFNYREPKKQLLHIVLLSFLVSFIIARLYSVYVGNSIYIGGYHIHHFYFGMIVLSIGGLVALLTNMKPVLRIASMLIGTGIGLFADELGLLLNCTSANRACTYYFPDTLDIIGSVALAIVSFIILADFVERSYTKRKNKKLTQEARIAASQPSR